MEPFFAMQLFFFVILSAGSYTSHLTLLWCSKKDVYEFVTLCHDFLDLFHLWRCALFSCIHYVYIKFKVFQCMTSRKSHQEISGVYDQIPSGHPDGFPFGKIQRQNTVARYAPNGKLSRVSPRLHHLSFLKCFTCEVLDLAWVSKK